MSFLEKIERARVVLERNGRVSFRVLRRELELDEHAFEELVGELVDVQQVAARDGKILSWIGSATAAAAATGPGADTTAAAPSDFLTLSGVAEGERRQLTVMFCDLVDSTELASGLDPEDWRDIVRSYQRACAAAVAESEGHVAQYLGDGMLVYFGYPRAHEHDAERAVRSGLSMLNSVRVLNRNLESEYHIQLAVRISVHTGLVVIGEMGGGERRETLALGDTANIAARLEGIAEADTLLISAATLRLVEGIFISRDLGLRALRGVPEPVQVHEILAAAVVQSRLGLASRRLTPAIGRERELALVVDRWEQVAEGRGQAVLIAGEAGIGKSRLVHLVREQLGDAPHSWIECRCSFLTQRTAFRPLIELLEQSLRLADADSPQDKLRRLEAALEASDRVPEEAVRLFASLLSLPHPEDHAALPQSPELRREKTIDALVAWVVAISRRHPVLLHVEDLHWCDPSTLEVIGRILEQTTTSRILTLLTLRPEFELPWTLGSHCIALPLRRLSAQEVRRMIATIAGGGALPESLVDRIVEKADGVPLFVEELTRMLLESDVSPESIPATLRDSLMARLDRLSSAKELAQRGSALGREFTYSLLAAISPEDDVVLRRELSRLVEAELLYCQGSPPDAIYTFKHALVQDAAYESLLKRTRRQLHARIVEILEDGATAGMPTELEPLARHCEAAGLFDKAIASLHAASEQAKRRSAHAEAILLLSHAIELTSRLSDPAEREHLELALQLSLGGSFISIGVPASDDAVETYERARELAERMADDEQLFEAIWGLRAAIMIRGDLTRSYRLCEELLDTASRTGRDQLLILAHAPMGAQLYWQGHLESALVHLRRAFELFQSERDAALDDRFASEPGSSTSTYEALVLWQLGFPDQAVDAAKRAIALARRPYDLANALAWAGVIRLFRREHELVFSLATDVVATAEEHGIQVYMGLGRVLLGHSIVSEGRDEAGMKLMEQGLSAIAGTGTGLGGPVLMGCLAEMHWLSRRVEQAEGAIRAGFHLAEQTNQHVWDAELHRIAGDLALTQDRPDVGKSERHFSEALRVAREQSARALELRAASSLARLWRDQGKQTEARELLAPIYEWFTEGFDTADLKNAKALLDELA